MQAIKVLIIAEEPEFSDILTDRLRSWGFAAVAAGNRAEAMEALVLSPPDVVVLSLRAGHGHDLETLRLIRNFDPAIEVILLTCKGTAITGMKGMERGAFDCLPQPIELGVLIERIRLAHARHNLPDNSSAMPLLLPLLSVDDWTELGTALLSFLQTLPEGLLLL
jgi:DNA-binding response OmpR family regulator